MTSRPEPSRSRLGQAQQLMVLSGLAGGWHEVARLLSQARSALDADEAALLLLDTAGGSLVPVAVSGLDVPVHSGFRVPIGEGFAGRVAATARPLVLTDISPETVLNPALHSLGVQSLLGVPVPGRPGPLGVVHVGSVTPRDFGTDDVSLLEQIAGEISAEVLRRRASEEHIAALALQRSLLPTSTPQIDGLDIAARYIPADGDLGGDWYDVFRLPDDRVGLVMGDVAGHGLASSVVMGRLRSALRAYALEHADPAKVLEMLDMKISYFEDGAVATVLYAVTKPPYDEFVISSAGHLAPLLVASGRAARAADVKPDPPLGVYCPDGLWGRHTTTVRLAPGSSMCLFTDGLVERRPSGDSDDQIDAGMASLRAAFRPEPADAACTAILTDLVGEQINDDDIAILIVHRLSAD